MLFLELHISGIIQYCGIMQYVFVCVCMYSLANIMYLRRSHIAVQMRSFFIFGVDSFLIYEKYNW